MIFSSNAAPATLHHNKSSQFSYLALIRFAMAYIVFAGHYGMVGQHSVLTYRLAQLGQFSAILVFLVISGYSIASSFQRETLGFYARRLGRIYPVFFIALTFYVVFLTSYAGTDVITTDGTHHGPVPSVTRSLLNYVFLNGVIGEQIIGTSWSLAVEAIFYIATPLLFLLVRSKYHLALLLFIAASAAFYWFHESLDLVYFANMRHSTAALALFFAWGMGFYFYFHRTLTAAIFFPIALCILINHYLPLGGTYSLPTLYVTSTLVFFADKLPPLNRHFVRLFNYLGELSYPLFILHYPLLIFLNYRLKLSNQFAIVGILLAVSAVVLAFIDKPCRRWIASRETLQVKNVYWASGVMTAFLVALSIASFFFYVYE